MIILNIYVDVLERKWIGVSKRAVRHDAVQNSHGAVDSGTVYIIWRALPHGYWKNVKKPAVRKCDIVSRNFYFDWIKDSKKQDCFLCNNYELSDK